MIVLVTGGRDFHKRRVVFEILDIIHGLYGITLLVQGFATGADQLAHEWAQANKVRSTGRKYRVTPEMWRRQGKAAGHIRNRAMRDNECPDCVVAFPGGRGTAGMVALARDKRWRIPVIEVDRKGNVL